MTLSACRSGASLVLRGDEPMGLARAFLIGGARAVLVTLWPVDDHAARLLMEHFYQALANGQDAATALRSAQRYLRGWRGAQHCPALRRPATLGRLCAHWSFMNDQQLFYACQQPGTIEQVEAFEILSAHLYRVALSILSRTREGDELAKDAMQLALIKVYRSLSQCKNSASFRSWAAKIARNAALDVLRVARRTVPLPEREDAIPPVPGPEPADDLALAVWHYSAIYWIASAAGKLWNRPSVLSLEGSRVCAAGDTPGRATLSRHPGRRRA